MYFYQTLIRSTSAGFGFVGIVLVALLGTWFKDRTFTRWISTIGPESPNFTGSFFAGSLAFALHGRSELFLSHRSDDLHGEERRLAGALLEQSACGCDELRSCYA